MPLSAAALLAEGYIRGRAAGFPRFNYAVERTNAFSASPYVLDVETLRRDFGTSSRRHQLLGAFDALLSGLSGSGHIPDHALIGGSFVDPGNPAPKDIDGVLFYASSPDAGTDSLSAIDRDARDAGLDLRLVARDIDSVLLTKITAFFASLYSTSRPGEASAAMLVVSLTAASAK